MSAPIVVGYDGHAPGVMRAGAMLARLLQTGIVAVCAYRYEASGLGAAPLPDPANEARLQAAERAVEQAVEHAPRDVAVQTRPVPAEDIVDALVDVAADVGAAAIVLAPDARGHVTADVARRAACPVLVAPADALLIPERPERIGVACDGSPAGHVAALAAQRLGELAGTRPIVLGVAHGAADAERLRSELEAAMASDGLDAELQILVGDTVTELRRASEYLDLLVCGSRGRGRITAAVLGSASAKLADDPPCSVLVVPHALRRDARRPLGVGVPPASHSAAP